MTTKNSPDVEQILLDAQPDPQSPENPISCRVTNSLLKYVASLGHDVASLAEGMPVSLDYLLDPFRWVSVETRDALIERAVGLTGDDSIMFKVGLKTAELSPISGIEHMVKLLGSPGLVYKNVPKYAAMFDKAARFEVHVIGDCRATVGLTFLGGYPASKHDCYYSQGTLAAVPTIWGLPPAEVRETRCGFQANSDGWGGSEGHGPNGCAYEVTWLPVEPAPHRLGERLFGRKNDRDATLKKLEGNFRALDAKNAELSLRNTQLSRVREIAMGIDRARKVDEVLELVVEGAREIPGVRFVIVNKVDATTGSVTTPYFSKIRGKAVENALKALGFDPDRQLGKNPNDRRLSFPLDQMPIAMDMVSNPRVIIRDQLSEVLEGTVIKGLGNAIQKLLNVTSLVLVPIMVDGQFWANMLFFLDGNVPTDILEMVAAHCAIAIKNVGNLEALTLRNRELAAVNTIITRTACSLDLDDVLCGALDEMSALFHDNASAIYLAAPDGKSLILRAQRGMPDSMRDTAAKVLVDKGVTGKFFTSGRKTTVGDLMTHVKDLPQHGALAESAASMPFVSVALEARGRRYGVLTLVRRESRGFDDGEVSLLESVADQLSVAIENSRLHGDALDTEDRLRRIIDSTAEGIAVSDLDGRLVRVNSATARMHGYESPQQMIGLSALDLIAPGDHSKAVEGMKRTLETGASGVITYSLVRKDGSVFPGEINASRITDASGKDIGFVAGTRDITERLRAQAALVASEEKYSALVEKGSDGIITIADGTIAFCNTAMANLVGVPSGEVVGRPVLDFIAEPYKRLVSETYRRRTAGESVPSRYEIEIVGKGGVALPVEVTASAMQWSGRPSNMVVVRDISERKRAEYAVSRLQKAVDASGEIIFMTDTRGTFTYVNPEFTRVYGYAASELIGLKTPRVLKGSDSNPHDYASFWQAILAGQTVKGDFTNRSKDGQSIYVDGSVNPIRDERGEISGFLAIQRDITLRREEQNRLRDSERRYSLIANSTVDYITLLNMRGDYIYVSPSHTKLGYEAEDLVGTSGLDLLYPEDKKRLVPMLAKYASMKIKELFGLKSERFSETVSFRVRDKSGNWHYMEANASLVDSNNGEGTNILLVSRDLTEKKRSEDALRQSEEKYRSIFDSANDILLLIDKKGVVVEVNKKITEIGGYDREELIGHNILTLTRILPARSLAKVALNFGKRMLGGNVPPYEVEMIKKDGEIAYVEINAKALRTGDKVVGDMAILRDITERRKSEETLRRQKDLIDRTLMITPNAVLVVGNDQKIVLANSTFERDFTNGRTTEGRPLEEFLPVAQLAKAAAEVLSGECEEKRIEFRSRVGGRERTLTASVLKMDQGQALVILNDVTADRERQDRLYLTDRLASVGEMASGIAHELNNPLTSVLGLSELLKEEALPGDLGEDVAAICREARRASQIVKNLLSFARRHEPVRQLVTASDVIDDVVKLRAYENKVNNIEVVTNVQPGLPQVMMDYFQMQQVFLNIVLNAEQAMIDAHGKGRLTITLERTEGILRISFADDGPGIAPDNLKRIFDPFFTTKEVGKGTGLGLSICYGIVTAHGGTIRAESKHGQGARFVVELPISN